MKWFLFLFFTSSLLSPASAAEKSDYWYKVEPKTKEEKKEKKEFYPYDSLEAKGQKQQFREVGFWSRRPKLNVGLGYFLDKEVFQNGKTNRWFTSIEISFRNRLWHRWMAGGQLLQNNSFLMSASWHYMPSRKATRIYYGVGGAHKLISEKEFRSLFEWDQYYITGSIGLESLLSQTRGWRGEVKAYLASGDYAFHLLISYIWSL